MKFHYFPKYFSEFELPSWEDIILDLNRKIENNGYVQSLNDMGFLTISNEISKVEKIKNHFMQLKNSNNMESHIYISFLTKSGTFGRHKDSMDVFFVMALGSMRWIIEEDTTQEYILMPGDVIYIPKGVYHTAIPLSPRVGLSIG